MLPFVAGLIIALLAGWWIFPMLLYERIDQPMQFNHAIHTGEEGDMSCEDCHFFRNDGSFSGIPNTGQCAECHEEPIGDSEKERKFVEEYIEKEREIPWLVYSRQPDNAYFPHANHVKLAKIPCTRCHGDHGGSEKLKPYERNRISGYSRDIWGENISGIASEPWVGMKMDDCSDCHEEKGVVESCLMCHK